MRKDDFDQFSALIDQAFALQANRVLEAPAKALFFNAVREYPIDAIERALLAHIKDPVNGRFPPQPAHLIAHMGGGIDNRPTADEAWAIGERATFNEAETVIMTNEIMSAWGFVEHMHDRIAARLAFKDHYARTVAAHRAQGLPCQWFASRGTDSERERQVIAEAVAAHLLPASSLAQLPPPERKTPLLIEAPPPAQTGVADSEYQKMRAALSKIGKSVGSAEWAYKFLMRGERANLSYETIGDAATVIRSEAGKRAIDNCKDATLAQEYRIIRSALCGEPAAQTETTEKRKADFREAVQQAGVTDEGWPGVRPVIEDDDGNEYV